MSLLHQQYVLPVAMLFLVLASSGCLLVRTSEHIVNLKSDGSGEGIIHLIDIRSNAPSDSLVRRDFDDMMKAYGSVRTEEFERYGRKVSSKRLRVNGDTLMAELIYSFSALDAIEGLRVTDDELILEFGRDREVVRTNGKTSRTEHQGTCITWRRDADRLVYEVREKQLPPSVSLASLYRRYMR